MKATEFNDDEKEFQKMVNDQFLKGYDEIDSIYDEESPLIPEYVKAGIERSRKQAEADMVTPHDEVMKKYAKYL